MEKDDQLQIQSRWHPAYMLQCAAQAAIERRVVLASASSKPLTEGTEVVEGPFVGQVMAKTEAGGLRLEYAVLSLV